MPKNIVICCDGTGNEFSDRNSNVVKLYQMLMRNFKPGDQVYVFGFSRGAYTARVICGLLHMVGLLREDNEGLIPYAIRLMKTKALTKELFEIAEKFRDTFSRDCKPHFV